MSFPIACPTCRTIRRFILSFALGGAVAWQINGAPPFGVADETWRGVTIVVLIFAVISIMVRLRQMRRRWDH